MKRISSILRTLPVPALAWDASTGRVLYANAGCAALLDGADVDALTLVPGGLDGGHGNAEIEVILSDGGDFLTPLNGWSYAFNDDTTVYFPGGKPSKEVLSAFDSARAPKAPSDAMRQTVDAAMEALGATGGAGAVESMPGMVYVKDTEKRYVCCSRAFADFLGLESASDIVGKTAFDVLSQESAEWTDRLDDTLFRTRKPSSEVHPFALGDGGPADWQRVSRAPLLGKDGRLIGLVATMKSENDVMRLAEELTMSKARLAAVTDVMSYNLFILALWNVDTLNAEYVSGSVAVLGYTPEKFKNLDDWAAIVHPDDRASFLESRQELRGKKLGVDFWHEYRVTDVGGITRHIRERVSSVMSPGAHLYRSVIVDVTARHGDGHQNGEILGDDGAQRPIHLLDLMSRQVLKSHCDRALKALKMTSFIMDADGVPLTDKSSPACELCAMLSSLPRGVELCRMSDVNLGLAVRESVLNGGSGMVIQPCDPLGLYVAALPIMLGERHLGTWIAGRVRVRGGVSVKNLRALFNRLGAEEAAIEKAVKAFEGMREWDAAEASNVFNNFIPYAEELSEMAQRGYMMMYNTGVIARPGEGSFDKDGGLVAQLGNALFAVCGADSDVSGNLTEVSKILCERFDLNGMTVIEYYGGGYSITFQHCVNGHKPLEFEPSLSDMSVFADRRPGMAAQCAASDTHVSGRWRNALKKAGAARAAGASYGNEQRPGFAVCFTAEARRGALTNDELRRMYDLLNPLAAFLSTRQSERKLSQSADSLQTIINGMRSAVYVVDRQSLEVLYSNRHFDGRDVPGPRGISCFRLLGRDGRCPSCALDAMAGRPDGMAYTYETDEREPGCWHNVTVTGITWTGGRPAYLVRARDVTEEKLQRERLLHAATHDLLLDIPMVGSLSARLDELIGAGRSGFLYLIDIDNTRQIMNAYGYKYSDALLKEIVGFLKETAGDSKVYRYASDTMAVILEDVSHDAALAFVDKLYKRFGKLWRILDKMCYATFSASMALYRDGVHMSDVLRNADLSLAKSIDRVRSSFFESGGGGADTRGARMTLAGDLHAMVEAGCDDMVVYYQPIFDISEGRVTHCEAFMRWQHHEKGLIPPLDFIGIAEHTSLIIPLSEAMMRTAVRQCRKWLDMGIDVGVSVNFSAAHSRAEGVLDAINSALTGSNLPPKHLQFELVEDVTINDRAHALGFISDLRQMGCLVAIDNFATGLSALSTVDATPVDVIKIDREFVSDACRNAYHAAVIEFAARTAKLCGMKLTCKGVETAEQLKKVRDLGADHIQGFILSRPLPADEVTELLLKKPDPFNAP